MRQGCYELELTKGYVALVDWEDAHALCAFKWTAREQIRGGKPQVYARRYRAVAEGPGPQVLLHHSILERMGTPVPKGMVGDHENGDGLDCRRKNLSVATVAGNRRNVAGARADSRSGILGVTQMPNGKYRAYIRIGGKLIHLDVFDTAEEADAARKIAELKAWGAQPRRDYGASQ